jgi:hypothetical protein
MKAAYVQYSPDDGGWWCETCDEAGITLEVSEVYDTESEARQWAADRGATFFLQP